MTALLGGGLLGPGPITLLALGVVALLGLLVAARLVLAPTAAAGVLMAVVVSNLSDVVGHVGPGSVYLAALGVATLALVLGVLRGDVVLRFSPFFLLFAVFVAARAASVLFAATDVGVGVAELGDEAKGLVLLVVLTLLLGSAAQPHRLTAATVGVVAALAALTAVQEFVLGDTSDLGGLSGIGVASEVAGLGARHSGTQTDPNFWCRVLVLLLPLALALMWSHPKQAAGTHRSRPALKWRWGGAALLLLLGSYLSQSRGGMIAMFVTAVVTLMLLVRNRARLLAGTAAVVLVLALLPGVGNRLATLASLSDKSTTTAVDASLQGREAAQRIGIAMFQQSPLFGVGAGNFEVAGDRFQRRLGISISQKGGLLAPHDIYVQQLAEGGLVGLLGYVVFYLGSIRLMLTTRRRWRALAALGRSGETEQRLAAAVAGGLVGWGMASAFLHLATLPILLVLLSIGASLHLRARQAEFDSGLGDLLSHPEPRRSRSRGRGQSPAVRTALALLGVALVGVGGVALQTALHARPGYTAAVRLDINPVGSGPQAYAYSVLDRERTVPTIITLALRLDDQAAADVGMTSADWRYAQVSAGRDPGGSSFRIRATTRRVDQAARLAAAVAQRLQTYLAQEKSLYQVRVLTITPTSPSGSGPLSRFGLAIACLLASLVLLGVTIRPSHGPQADGPPEEDDFPESHPPGLRDGLNVARL